MKQKQATGFRTMPPTRLQRLQALYARVPPMLCQGKCQDSCGPISFHPIEVDLLRSRGIALPMIAEGDESMTCSALSDEGLCSIYDVRPLVCRLWGAVAKMRCHHGCLPARFLSRDEEDAMLQEICDLSGITFGELEKCHWTLGGPPTELIDALAQQRQAAALGVGVGMPTATIGAVTGIGPGIGPAFGGTTR